MRTSAVALVTLVALPNLTLIGCVRRVPVQLYETGQLRHDRISGVVDKRGGQRRFTEPGGAFRRAANEICGTSDDSSRTCTRLADLDSVLVMARVYDQILSTAIPSEGFVSYLQQRKPSKITGVVTTQNTRYTFGWSGARIDPSAQALTGYAPDGSPLQVSLSDIDRVIVQKPDHIANALLGIGIGGVFSAILIYLALDAAFGGL